MQLSPTPWLLSRLIFDVIPLRLVPTIIVSVMLAIPSSQYHLSCFSGRTYWMAGLAPDPLHFFKFLFILLLYSFVMTLFVCEQMTDQHHYETLLFLFQNLALACIFRNGGVAILVSALAGLYQMTFSGFFVHLGDIPPVLRWLQWLAPLHYVLEALSVNEAGSSLQIQDTIQGVPISISAISVLNLVSKCFLSCEFWMCLLGGSRQLFGFGANNYYR
jgi:hypothetical protein